MQLLLNRLKFAATPTAPGCARVFVRHTLCSWLLPGLAHDAELIVSELVTNAVRATGTTDPHATYADLEGLALLGVQVRVAGESLFVEVWDDDREKPDRPPADRDPDECGRGLIIVAALSTRHGVERATPGGKVVWAELALGDGLVADPEAEAEALPRGYRRVTLSEARRPAEPSAADLALMERMAGTANAPARQAG